MLQDQTLNDLLGEEVEGRLSAFLEFISFSPIIDVPLTVGLIFVFVLYFRVWAVAAESETSVDLPARLMTACIRAALFFVSVLALCYVTDMGVWLVAATLLLVGVVLSVILMDQMAVELMLRLCVVGFREACFGLPLLILRAEPAAEPQADPKAELVGLKGNVVSPLRPSGYIEINGEEKPAVSDSGELIEIGSVIVVAQIRNGQLYVKLDG